MSKLHRVLEKKKLLSQDYYTELSVQSVKTLISLRLTLPYKLEEKQYSYTSKPAFTESSADCQPAHIVPL